MQPSTGIREGSSVTVLCVAMGSPTPNITLYIAGHPIRSEQTRHMVTTIHNITKYHSQIACHADNGFGVPMQSSRTIQVERRPRIIKPKLATVAMMTGQNFQLDCTIDGYPIPTMGMGKLGENQLRDGAIIKDLKSDIDYEIKKQLFIPNIKLDDGGTYYCYANNSIGKVMKRVTLRVRDRKAEPIGLNNCCVKQNVSTQCLGLCSLSLDLDFLLYQPDCFSEFHKLMFCASGTEV